VNRRGRGAISAFFIVMRGHLSVPLQESALNLSWGNGKLMKAFGPGGKSGVSSFLEGNEQGGHLAF